MVSRTGALLGLAALGVGLFALASREPVRQGTTVPPPVPPPLTLAPKGRYLTAFERFIMNRYGFTSPTLNAARLWFGRPSSSFTQEGDAEKGVKTEALTKGPDIYFRFENREFSTPDDLALLAHELKHVEQNVVGPKSDTPSENEVAAYITQVSAKQDLDVTLQALMEEWTGPRYA